MISIRLIPSLCYAQFCDQIGYTVIKILNNTVILTKYAGSN